MALYLALCAVVLLAGCYVRQACYVSPLNGNEPGYHTLPSVRDSARSAVYAGLQYFNGKSNDYSTDDSWGFHWEGYRAHHGRHWQAYYGLDLTMGNFNTGQWDTADRYRPRNASALNDLAGDHFFGALGVNTGFNLVLPMRHAEWRYLGIDANLHREFGDYLTWRRGLSDTMATLDIKSRLYSTIGFNSEIVGLTSYGEFGFRWSTGWALGQGYQRTGIHSNSAAGPLSYGYFNFSMHLTVHRYTGYLQVTKATKAYSVQWGLQLRLSRPRMPALWDRY